MLLGSHSGVYDLRLLSILCLTSQALGEPMLSLILNKRQDEHDAIPCTEPAHFLLTSAYLCPDCNSVGNSAMQCPACASTVLLNLSTVLDRKVETVEEEIEREYEYEFVPASTRMRQLQEVAA